MQNNNMKNECSSLNVFWDLDGVIFKYSIDDYVGPDPAYARPGYFRHREPDKIACVIFKNMSSCSNIISLNVLSRGATRLSYDARVAVVNDKKECVRENLPWLDESHVFVTHDSKVESAEQILGRKLCETDILIDDFNENITAWRNAGGTSIKYINGLNSVESYSGPKIIGGKLVDAPEWLVRIFGKFMQ